MAASTSSFVSLKFSSFPASRFVPLSLRIRTGATIFPFWSLKLNRNFVGRHSFATSASSRPPPSPPSSGEDQNFFSGLRDMLSRAEDGIRIFFAVLFWMSLFFWGSAWDGRADDNKKGPRIRKWFLHPYENHRFYMVIYTHSVGLKSLLL